MPKRTKSLLPPDPEWPASRCALAKELGCHPNSISRWNKEFKGEPDLPTRHNGGRDTGGRWNLAAWKKFAANRNLTLVQDDLALESITAIKRKQEIEKLTRFKRENKVAEAQLFSLDEVRGWLARKGAILSALIHQRLTLEAPVKLAGLTALEIAARMEPIEKELIESFLIPLEGTKK